MLHSLHRENFGLSVCLGLLMAMFVPLSNAEELVRLKGRVSLEQNNYPVEGAHLQVQGTAISHYTGADGGFNLALPAGVHTLLLDYLGLSPQQYRIEVKASGKRFIHLRLKADDDLSEVLLLGQSATTNKALNLQRSVDNFTQVLSNDAVGQFADANVAESLARLPGIAITRDQGEGRYARVRGLSEELTSVSFNGSVLAAPSDRRRAIALDVVPSDLVSALVVSQSLTADQDANAIGGHVDIQSVSGFDRDELYYSLNLENWYARVDGQHSPKLSASVSNVFDFFGGEHNFAVAASVSYQDRGFSSSNVEANGNWDFSASPQALEEAELRHYDINRERLAVGVNIDYQHNEQQLYYARLLHSRRDDEETRHGLEAEFDSAIAVGETSAGQASRELKQRLEIQQINSYLLGTEIEFDDWLLSSRLAYSQAKERQPEYIDGAKFTSLQSIAGFNYSDNRKPVFSAGSELYDSANFALDEVEISRSNTRDSIASWGLDLTRQLRFFDSQGQLQFGAKVTQRRKQNDESKSLYSDFAAVVQPLNLYQLGEIDYQFGRLGRGIDSALIYQNLDQAISVQNIIEDSLGKNFNNREQILAAYVMYGWDWQAWSFLAGLRYEATEQRSTAYAVDLADQSSALQRSKNSYRDWLPSLHIKYQWDSEQEIKLALSQALARPDFEQLSASRVFDSAAGEGEAGNPQLKPWHANNLNLAYQRYFGLASSFSLQAFYKDIDDYIYQTTLSNQQGLSRLTTFVNGSHADLYGLELGFNHAFNSLPKPWDGLMLSSNLSLVDSEANYAGRTLALTKQSDAIANLSLGYESTRFSARLSFNQQSDYLEEVGANADEDVYVDAQTQIDLTLRYWLNKELQVYMHGINLSDQELYLYNRSESYNRQYERYGQTWVLGVRWGRF